MRILKVKKGTIITYEEEGNLKLNNIEIEVITAYKYILEVLNKK
jgi:hypothetical protein